MTPGKKFEFAKAKGKMAKAGFKVVKKSEKKVTKKAPKKALKKISKR